ncbi:hypothetical protein ABET41_21565 [Metabacillus fastidiosus]|uniref:Uncharacterized protein n=1 Tax=Metabacillus fastidiosus TaxID=1458 RepID=A0ABU6NZT1_9BACI|nr:hypothetical protein [Metabacillus fastidiosus]MED4402541.1 hypothetical protein [Metabacillus fastidiosus]MED4461899.1 hypothetical protein [Metabacillus fastidiosus]
MRIRGREPLLEKDLELLLCFKENAQLSLEMMYKFEEDVAEEINRLNVQTTDNRDEPLVRRESIEALENQLDCKKKQMKNVQAYKLEQKIIE